MTKRYTKYIPTFNVELQDMNKFITYLFLLIFYLPIEIAAQTNYDEYRDKYDTVFKHHKTMLDTNFAEGDLIRLPIIYFALSGGGGVMNTESVYLMGKFIAKYPNLQLEIGVHTDYRGASRANRILSERRGQVIQRMLIDELGIDEKRIPVKGYGEDHPLIPETTIQQESDKIKKELMHEKNRRVEFKVLSTKFQSEMPELIYEDMVYSFLRMLIKRFKVEAANYSIDSLVHLENKNVLTHTFLETEKFSQSGYDVLVDLTLLTSSLTLNNFLKTKSKDITHITLFTFMNHNREYTIFKIEMKPKFTSNSILITDNQRKIYYFTNFLEIY